MDTDCTGATVGALMGILDPGGIPERWTQPIGRSLVLSPDIVGLHAPDTLDGFTDLVVGLKDRLEGRMPEAEPPAPSAAALVDRLQIRVEADFVDEMPAAEAAPALLHPASMILPGTVGTLAAGGFTKDVLLLRYRFVLADAQDVRVLFNTPQVCRVWVDGKYAFGRAGGAMAPSFHRAPADQYADLSLGAGEHVLVAAVEKPEERPAAEWVAGVGDRQTMQWLLQGFASA